MALRARRYVIMLVVAALTATGLVEFALAPAARAKAGDVTTIPVPGTGGGNIVTGADGNLWWGDGNINRTTLGGVTTSFPTSNIGETHIVTPGPDGNIWYVNRKGSATDPNIVGRVTPAGTVTEFPVTSSGLPERSITAGPDGNLWILFEGSSGDTGLGPMLARATTAGVVTTYIIDSETLATSIVAGPGGKIWWLDNNNKAIHSVDPSNPTTTLQTFPGPTQFSPGQSVTGLQVGRDGNVWAASGQSARPYLLRITPNGGMTAVTVKNLMASMNGLLTGPDGGMWFNSNLGELHRLNPDGTQTNFSSIGCRCDPMTVGPDGRVWTFDAAGAKLIGVSTGDTSDTVLNLASGFSSPDVRLANFGSTLRFVFTGPTSATATDATGLGLFDSGIQALGSHYDYTFPGAGTYTYNDTLQPSHSGTVAVPPVSSRRYAPACAYGCGVFDIRWATDVAPAGFVYDVQQQAYGGVFADYLIGTTQPSSLEWPLYPSTYSYRARLRRTSDNVATGYSPPVTVQYGNEYAAFDGYSTDISVYRPDGNWYIHPSSVAVDPSNTDFGTNYGGEAGDVPVPGDYDGDGGSNVAIYRPSTGLWAIHLGVDNDTFVTYGGIAGDIPIPADYDGDGITDLAIFRPSVGTWWVHNSSNGIDVATTFGIPGDVPVPGADFDGDGKADLVVFRNGVWYVHQSSDGADTTTTFGSAGDVPVPGNYDGDGKLDIAVFRPSTSTWFFHPTAAPDTAIIYGIPGDIPVAGDYDADGLTDVAAFRPSSGNWYIHYAAQGSSDTSINFGITGDIPLPLPPAVRLAYYP